MLIFTLLKPPQPPSTSEEILKPGRNFESSVSYEFLSVRVHGASLLVASLPSLPEVHHPNCMMYEHKHSMGQGHDPAEQYAIIPNNSADLLSNR
jgi:hypothetical protein